MEDNIDEGSPDISSLGFGTLLGMCTTNSIVYPPLEFFVGYIPEHFRESVVGNENVAAYESHNATERDRRCMARALWLLAEPVVA